MIVRPNFVIIIAIHPLKHLNKGRNTGMGFLMSKYGLKNRCCIDFTKMLLGSFTNICGFDFIECKC